MSKKSGTITLPISEHKAKVGEPLRGPHAVSMLQECWVRVTGILDKLRQPPLLCEFLRVVDKVVVIDELTIIHPDMGGLRGAPVMAKIWCRDPTVINGMFEIFHARNGFMMRVERELGGPLAPLPPLPSPPRPRSDEDPDGGDESGPSLNTAEWDAAGANTGKSTKDVSSSAVVSSGMSGRQAASLLPEVGDVGVPQGRLASPRLPPMDTPRMLRREESLTPLAVNQYGSNLVSGGLPLLITKNKTPVTEVEEEGVGSPALGRGGARTVGSGITAAYSPIPSASSTPCSSPVLRSAASIAAILSAVATARAAGVSPVQLVDRFEGEEFVDNLMAVDDCVEAFEAFRDGELCPHSPVIPPTAAVTVSPTRASRTSARVATTKASKMMDKAMTLKAGKTIQAVETVGKIPRQKARGGARYKGANKVH